MRLGKTGRHFLALYVRFEAGLSVLAATLTLASVMLALWRPLTPIFKTTFEDVGIVAGVVTLVLVGVRVNGAAARMLRDEEGRLNLAMIALDMSERLVSLVEKMESGADFLARPTEFFSFSFARDHAELRYFVKWSEADAGIADSQSDSLDRARLYREWFDARPDIFMLARNSAGVPFCGSIVLPLKERGAELLERDGACAVTLRRPEIALSKFHHLLIDTWVGDLRLQSHHPRRHPPFDILTQAGYGLRMKHLAHFVRLGGVRYIWVEPSNPSLVKVLGQLPFVERKGDTGKPDNHSYVLSVDAAKAIARGARTQPPGDMSPRIERLLEILGQAPG